MPIFDILAPDKLIHIKIPLDDRVPPDGLARIDAAAGRAGETACCLLTYLNAVTGLVCLHHPMWHLITTAPIDRDIELAVLDGDGPHALVFPCRRIAAGWMNAQSGERLDVRPTHWREWADGGAASSSAR